MAERTIPSEKYPFQIFAQRTGVEAFVQEKVNQIRRKWLGEIRFSRRVVTGSRQSVSSESSPSLVHPEPSASVAKVANTDIRQTTIDTSEVADTLTINPQGIQVTRRETRTREKILEITGDPERDTQILRQLGLTQSEKKKKPSAKNRKNKKRNG